MIILQVYESRIESQLKIYNMPYLSHVLFLRFLQPLLCSLSWPILFVWISLQENMDFASTTSVGKQSIKWILQLFYD